MTTQTIAFPLKSRVNMIDSMGGRSAATVVRLYADLPNYRGIKFDENTNGRGVACPVDCLEMRNS